MFGLIIALSGAIILTTLAYWLGIVPGWHEQTLRVFIMTLIGCGLIVMWIDGIHRKAAEIADNLIERFNEGHDER